MKKIYQIIMFCAMVVALASCGKINYEKEINDAIEASDFILAHTILTECLEDYRKPGSGGIGQSTYVNCLVKLYTSEVNYLIEQEDIDCSNRVIALYKEFEGKQIGDAGIIKMTDTEFANHILELAINTKNDYLIEKCLTSIGVYNPKSIQYILSNNSEGESVVMKELSSVSVFSNLSEGEWYGHNRVTFEKDKAHINNHNQTCITVIYHAIRNNNISLAKEALRIMTATLGEADDENVHYSKDDMEKANEIIEKAIADGSLTE